MQFPSRHTLSLLRRSNFVRFSSGKIIEQEELLFPVASNKNLIDDWNTPRPSDDTEPQTLGDTQRLKLRMPPEFGFKAKFNEPTIFGDWQHKGRTTDF
jgi:Protein of unknown function (DUF1674)